ncbi:hypothetical protein NE865_09515 [Phthorimaea operculella]|nr:hypothetical protein NE865_09515 [Phthorimaea operculella]
MKAVAGCLFVLMVASLGSTDMSGECDMAHFYQELGCEPITDTAADTTKSGVNCPHAFNCPNLHPDPTMCYYRGVGYPDRSPLPETVIKNPCSKACLCSISNGVPNFSCAAVDCVEFFEGDLNGECIRTYSLESCCSVGKVCGKDAIAALKTCEMEGKTYKEGQTFSPEKTHKTCLCTDKWTGKAEGEYCQDVNCGLEIHYQDMLYQNCAPVFPKKGSACPMMFKCPSSDMKLIKGLNVRGVSAQCAFGNQTLSVGDALDFGDCTRCECNVPPFLDCLKQSTAKCQKA